jgi:hypothetical protein
MVKRSSAIHVFDFREPSAGIEFCDPGIRQFSELPAWFDANEDCLRDKHVYM